MAAFQLLQLQVELLKAERAWQRGKSTLLNERSCLLSERRDLQVENSILHTSNARLRAEKADFQATVEMLQAENRFLRHKQPLRKEPMHKSAAHRVFAIPELLELILLQVPISLTKAELRGPNVYKYLISRRPVTLLFPMLLASFTGQVAQAAILLSGRARPLRSTARITSEHILNVRSTLNGRKSL